MPDTSGSIAKLEWANRWDGIYLGCDDDIQYPIDYVKVMSQWIKIWEGQAIVTCHGRILREKSVSFLDAEFSAQAFKDCPGRWINYPGGLGIGFHTSLDLPNTFPGKSTEEAALAVLAQERQIPIWLVPHKEGWLRWLLAGKNLPTIWAEEKSTGFVRRNKVLEPQGSGSGWKIYEPRIGVVANA